MSRRQPSSRRPCFPAISDQMKAWAGALAADLADWPQVSMRPMFGFTACYRRDVIFALLPKSRGIESPSAIAFKLSEPSTPMRKRIESDSRIRFTDIQKSRWFLFELARDEDLRDALEWLDRAYRAAK